MDTSELRRQMEILARLSADIVELARKSPPPGLPRGPIYAALMSKMSYEQYGKFEQLLCDTGLLQIKGDCFVAVKEVSSPM